jgi:hypothetical protein
LGYLSAVVSIHIHRAITAEGQGGLTYRRSCIR